MEGCFSLFQEYKCQVTCRSGCFCRMGLKRTRSGRCVPHDQCPQYAEREWMTSTTKKPEPQTDGQQPVRPSEDPGSTSDATKGPDTSVGDTECPMNEVWSECDSHCKEMCENAPLKAQYLPVEDFDDEQEFTTKATTVATTTKIKRIEPTKVTYKPSSSKEKLTKRPANSQGKNRYIGPWAPWPNRRPHGVCIGCNRWDRYHITYPYGHKRRGFGPKTWRVILIMTRSKVKSESCSPNMNCLPGCYCLDGFYRNATDHCVPVTKCPPRTSKPKPPVTCPVNEDYTECGSKCAELCESVLSSNYTCDPSCEQGCFCKMGFFRDRWGRCVPSEQCECEIPAQKCVDPNEEYNVCGKNCWPTCDNTGANCREACARGCFCKKGYYYNENGVCVQIEDCGTDVVVTKGGTDQTSKECSANERWTDCGNVCKEHCEPTTASSECQHCKTGCFCITGHKRNKAGQCVPTELCDQRPDCGDNEEYSKCSTVCGKRCKDIGKDVDCSDKCQIGCFCMQGYYRDDQGQCVPRATCKIIGYECPEYEVFRNCSTRCGEGCEDLRAPVKCPKPEQECEKGCFCAKDYWRDDEGRCGTRADCNIPEPVTEVPACEPNEYYKDCGNRCEESCEDSTRCTQTCESGCFCVDDFLRNKKGKCVPGNKCKGAPHCAECGPNEYFTDCGTDCGKMCTDLVSKDKQVCDKKTPCHLGCLCKFGFYRTPQGLCVTRNQCKYFNAEETVGHRGGKGAVKSFSLLRDEYYSQQTEDYYETDYDHSYQEYYDNSPGYGYDIDFYPDYRSSNYVY